MGEDKDGDGCGEPVKRYKKPDVGRIYPIETPIESDEFNTRQLGLQWEWHANYQDTFGFTSDLGYIRIYGHILSKDFVIFWEVPNLLLQKIPCRRIYGDCQTESFCESGRTAVRTDSDGVGLWLSGCSKRR